MCKQHAHTSTSTGLCITRVKTAKGNWEIDVSSASNHHRPPLTHVFNCFKKKKKKEEKQPLD